MKLGVGFVKQENDWDSRDHIGMIGMILNRLLGRCGGSGRGNLGRGNPSPTITLYILYIYPFFTKSLVTGTYSDSLNDHNFVGL